MPKTKKLTIICGDETRIVPNGKKLTLHIEEPDIEDALMAFHSDDIIQYVQANYGVEEVYDEDELGKWAEENGYTKQ